MIAQISPKLQLEYFSENNIQGELVFEILDNKPIFFNRYKEVLNGNLIATEIIYSSSLKSIIASYILRIFHKSPESENYISLTGRPILHIDNKNNFSSDIVILDRNNFSIKDANDNYLDVNPKIFIQIDIIPDTENFDSPDNYVFKKTEKLLNFGVEKVIWIMADTKKVIVATKEANWEIINWNNNIEIIGGVDFNIGQYLREKGSPFA